MGEDVQETEAEVRAAIEKLSGINLKGECEMETRLATEWEIRSPSPKPPPPLGIQTVSLRHAGRGTVTSDGTVRLWDIDTDADIVRGVDIHWLIASLQSILVLAEEHFGEDWGKCEKRR